MQQSLSVVLERNTRLAGTFRTEPYEVAWAREARWFIRVLDVEGDNTALTATTQISPDGLYWCDLEDSSASIEGTGLVSWPARDFGGWLRIRVRVNGNEGASAKVMIYLVLKS